MADAKMEVTQAWRCQRKGSWTASTGTSTYKADTANAMPLFGQSVNISKPILKQLKLLLSACSDHNAAERW